MRLRHNKQAGEKLQHSALIVPEVFLKDSDILEIGCGKAAMIIKMAQNTPTKQFYGLEKSASVLYQGVKQTEKLGLKNLKFVLGDAENLKQKIRGECEEIWLSFPDPWPKLRHTKRRLTHQKFLKQYKQILKTGGRLKIKTDSEKLYFFTLQHLKLIGARIIFKTKNLHDSTKKTINVLSNYEQKWIKEGRNIYYIEAIFLKTVTLKTVFVKWWAKMWANKHDRM